MGRTLFRIDPDGELLKMFWGEEVVVGQSGRCGIGEHPRRYPGAELPAQTILIPSLLMQSGPGGLFIATLE